MHGYPYDGPIPACDRCGEQHKDGFVLDTNTMACVGKSCLTVEDIQNLVARVQEVGTMRPLIARLDGENDGASETIPSMGSEKRFALAALWASSDEPTAESYVRGLPKQEAKRIELLRDSILELGEEEARAEYDADVAMGKYRGRCDS